MDLCYYGKLIPRVLLSAFSKDPINKIYSWPLNNAGGRLANTLQIWKSTYNLQSILQWQLLFILDSELIDSNQAQIMQYHRIYSWKKNLHKSGASSKPCFLRVTCISRFLLLLLTKGQLKIKCSESQEERQIVTR